MFLVLLLGFAASKILYSYLPKKSIGEPSSEKIGGVSLSSPELPLSGGVKNALEKKSNQTPDQNIDEGSRKPESVESDTQEKNDASIALGKLTEAEINPDSVIKERGKAPPLKENEESEEVREMASQDVKEMVEKVNISPSMKVSLEDKNTKILFSDSPSKIVPDARFIQLKNGDYYLGLLTETGSPTGIGILVYEDNSIYEGMFKNGNKDQIGKLTDANGVVHIGYFYKDHYVGKLDSPITRQLATYRIAREDPYFFIGHWEKKLTYSEDFKYEVLWMDFSFDSHNKLVLARIKRERNSGQLHIKDLSHSETMSWIMKELIMNSENVLFLSKTNDEFTRLSKRIQNPLKEKSFSLRQKTSSTATKK